MTESYSIKAYSVRAPVADIILGVFTAVENEFQFNAKELKALY